MTMPTVSVRLPGGALHIRLSRIFIQIEIGSELYKEDFIDFTMDVKVHANGTYVYCRRNAEGEIFGIFTSIDGVKFDQTI